MNRIARGFDLLAPVYDGMTKAFFGKSIRQAQVHFLEMIPSGAKVLVLGGGTGWLIGEIKRVTHDVVIWYVEISGKMMEHTRKRVGDDKAVHLVEGTLADVKETNFDVVITPFFLDLFPDERLSAIVSGVRSCCTANACWLVCDFVNHALWHRVWLWVMYRFFALTCRLEAVSLPDWQGALRRNGLACANEKRFFRNFICSAVYRPD